MWGVWCTWCGFVVRTCVGGVCVCVVCHSHGARENFRRRNVSTPPLELVKITLEVIFLSPTNSERRDHSLRTFEGLTLRRKPDRTVGPRARPHHDSATPVWRGEVVGPCVPVHTHTHNPSSELGPCSLRCQSDISGCRGTTTIDSAGAVPKPLTPTSPPAGTTLPGVGAGGNGKNKNESDL